MIFRTFQRGCKRIGLCSTRQATGKSVGIAIIALHSAYYNSMPSGIHKNTKVGIISKSDEQSKKLMNEIKRLVSFGDLEMAKRTMHLQNHPNPRFRNIFTKDYFSGKIDKNATNNMTQMSFKDGSFIKCFPPTDACRGESFDIAIVDEAAFVDENIYKDAIYPTITQTRGTIILSSTPRGQKGFFFKIFDPFNIQENHEFTRFWFNWRQCENPDIRDDILKKQAQAQLDGDTKSFQQEYDALFTIDSEAFFDADRVDDAVDKSLNLERDSPLPVCVGVDFGMVNCPSVVTIVAEDKDGLKLVNQVCYPLGTHDTVVYEDLKDINKRFNVLKFVLDDGPQSFRTITDLQKEGHPLLPFSFKKDKIKGYYLFRGALNNGRFIMPHITGLIVEMKALVNESGYLNEKICKPRGGSDDRIDSVMMACFPFLKQDDAPTKSFVVGDGALVHETDPKTGADRTWKHLTDSFERGGGEQRLRKINNPLYKKGYM